MNSRSKYIELQATHSAITKAIKRMNVPLAVFKIRHEQVMATNKTCPLQADEAKHFPLKYRCRVCSFVISACTIQTEQKELLDSLVASRNRRLLGHSHESSLMIHFLDSCIEWALKRGVRKKNSTLSIEI